jgi:hypothetical protein
MIFVLGTICTVSLSAQDETRHNMGCLCLPSFCFWRSPSLVKITIHCHSVTHRLMFIAPLCTAKANYRLLDPSSFYRALPLAQKCSSIVGCPSGRATSKRTKFHSWSHQQNPCSCCRYCSSLPNYSPRLLVFMRYRRNWKLVCCPKKRHHIYRRTMSFLAWFSLSRSIYPCSRCLDRLLHFGDV